MWTCSLTRGKEEGRRVPDSRGEMRGRGCCSGAERELTGNNPGCVLTGIGGIQG